MFGVGTTELIIILLVIMVIFGASRLPALGKGLGSGMRNFRDALRGSDDKNDGASLEKASHEQPKRADRDEGESESR